MKGFRFFRRDSVRELKSWVDDGLISAEQGEAILSRYGASWQDAEGHSFGYFLLTAMAALFAGLALILIMSHNWDEMPRMARMLGLILLTLVVNLQGARVFLAGKEQAGVIWLFFGGLCYGASIMLIAQIYHLGEHYPDGIFWWALGILPLAALCRSRLLALQVLALAIIWMFVESFEDFFPALFPLFALVTLWVSLVAGSSRLLFLLSILSLLLWLNLLMNWYLGDWWQYHWEPDTLAINIALGLMLAGGAWRMMSTNRFHLKEHGHALQHCVLLLGILTLVVLSFDGMWRELRTELTWSGSILTMIVGIASICAIALSWHSSIFARIALGANGLFYTLGFLNTEMMLLPDQVMTVMTNLMLVFTGIYNIRRGIDESNGTAFYTGVSVLLLTALLRYFDLVGDYIGGAMLFMLCAAVLYGAARYWRYRREAAHEE